jgi:hypothetical protein
MALDLGFSWQTELSWIQRLLQTRGNRCRRDRQSLFPPIVDLQQVARMSGSDMRETKTPDVAALIRATLAALSP